jgi:O-methyltransferase involved in polyketide biosynthesis
VADLARPSGGLAITALYTSHTWVWGGFANADLLATPEAKRVFDLTNAALAAARLVNPRLPHLRESLVHRHAMIDRLAAGATRIVEIAAGLSRRGATLSADPAIDYTELDLPPVAARKRELLARTDAGRAVLARPNFRIVAADVEHDALPAGDLVIAEGLMMYLQPDSQRALFAKAHATGARLVFDLVPSPEEPAPGRAGRFLEAVMKRFTGGRGFTKDDRTRADILAELVAVGFTPRALEPRDVPGIPHSEWTTRMVVFEASP